jgi:hypothetical protein
VVADLGYGRERSENALNSRGIANIEAALDDLETRLPNCRSVMLVVAWFGTDLRCAECDVRPGVETVDKVTRSQSWVVNGVDRPSAYVVSTTDGRPTYGGTPSDASVLEAIAAIKARGLAVGVYPFILMDIPPGNELPDPYGAAEQAVFPWRGRITCHPAAGQPESPDKTTAAGDQVRAFFGACEPGHFAPAGATVSYSGPAEWSFRRFVLHYARLAAMVGGVDAFLIGSELRGLTSVRESASTYPATDELCALAGDVRSILGSSVKISYAADWSEYFGHQPQDGSGDVFFNLDDLWSDADIDFVGVDWYAPLSDWRDGQSHLDAATAGSIYDRSYLSANIEGGEGYDWWYPDDAAREAQARAPIADGAGKPWVFRYKDLRSWWSEPHFDRPDGVESETPTSWTPESKPIWFVELGFPAVDKGANQPNVFVDPKSSESHLPYYSTGARDDLIQRRALEAVLEYWRPDADANPVSSVYSGPMLVMENAHVWTWDARPFPDFPARLEQWSDGANWRLGHWLTGRVGLAPLSLVVEDLVGRIGEPVDVSALEGLVSGFVVDRPMSARAALESLARVYDFVAVERHGTLAFVPRSAAPADAIDLDRVVLDDQARRLARVTDDASARAHEARLSYIDELRDYRAATVTTRDATGGASRAVEAAEPIVLDQRSALACARGWIADAQAGGEGVRLRLPPSTLTLEAGDAVLIDSRPFRIERIEEAERREVSLRGISSALRSSVAGAEAGVSTPALAPPATPYGVVLDLPLSPNESERGGPRVAVSANPWPGEVVVGAGGDAASQIERARAARPCAVGELLWDLHAGPIGRWDEGNYVQVKLVGQPAQSASKLDVLNGANALAVEGPDGEWEVIQFREATLVAPETYEIRGFLRGLLGTEGGQASPVAAGARVVSLGGAPTPAPLAAHERGVALEWRFAPRGLPFGDQAAGSVVATYAGSDLRPLSPVHLRVRRAAGDLEFSWCRRTRVGGDDWTSMDVPLGEAEERYLFELLDDGEVILAREVTGAQTLVTAAEETALLPVAPHHAFAVRVAQISASYGVGAQRQAFVYI